MISSRLLATVMNSRAVRTATSVAWRIGDRPEWLGVSSWCRYLRNDDPEPVPQSVISLLIVDRSQSKMNFRGLGEGFRVAFNISASVVVVAPAEEASEWWKGY